MPALDYNALAEMAETHESTVSELIRRALLRNYGIETDRAIDSMPLNVRRPSRRTIVESAPVPNPAAESPDAEGQSGTETDDFLSSDQLGVLEVFLGRMQALIDSPPSGASPDEIAEIHAQLQTVMLQTKGQRGSRKIVVVALRIILTVITGIVTGIAGNSIYHQYQVDIDSLLKYLQF